jgi:hypothetical protein
MKTPMKKRFFKKKLPFLLLEVLLAIQLVAFGALYVIQNPLRFFRAEIQSLSSMEYQRLADWTFSEIKEQFYLQQIPLEKIAAKKKESDFSLWGKPLETSFPQMLRPVYRFYRIYGKEREGKDKNKYRYLTIELFLSPLANPPKKNLKVKNEPSFFTYHLFIQRNN